MRRKSGQKSCEAYDMIQSKTLKFIFTFVQLEVKKKKNKKGTNNTILKRHNFIVSSRDFEFQYDDRDIV